VDHQETVRKKSKSFNIICKYGSKSSIMTLQMYNLFFKVQ